MQDERPRSVILDYIEHEVERSYDNINSTLRATLTDAGIRLFMQQLPFDECKSLFLQHTGSDSLPNKIKQIMEVTDVPLPPPTTDGPPTLIRGTRKKSFPWTDAEDVRLLVAVSRFGARDWRTIAEFVGAGRTSSQCNQRWCRALDPSISHKAWTEEDDNKLQHAVQVLGKGSWCQVAKILTGRTDLQCRYRYLQLVKANEQLTTEREANQSPPEVDMDAVMMSRRNSISIAMFTLGLDEMVSAGSTPKMLPYYLESSLVPRDDPTARYLHRVPPLLCSRVSKQ